MVYCTERSNIFDVIILNSVSIDSPLLSSEGLAAGSWKQSSMSVSPVCGKVSTASAQIPDKAPNPAVVAERAAAIELTALFRKQDGHQLHDRHTKTLI